MIAFFASSIVMFATSGTVPGTATLIVTVERRGVIVAAAGSCAETVPLAFVEATMYCTRGRKPAAVSAALASAGDLPFTSGTATGIAPVLTVTPTVPPG